MSTKHVSFAFGAALIALALGFGVRVLADGAPTEQPLFYSGTLESDGQPVTGAHTVTLELFGSEQAASALCSIDRMADVEQGRFRIDASECADVMRDNPDVWIAVSFRGSDGATHAIEGRAKVGAVPYALEADRAKTAEGASGALAATIEDLMDRVAELESGAGGGSRTAFYARATSSPELTAATAVRLTFDEEIFDVAGDYDHETGIFKAQADGQYEFICSIAWGIDTNDKVGQYEAAVFLNGVERAYSGHTGDGIYTTRQVHVIMQLEVNDEVTCHAFQEPAGTGLNTGGFNNTFAGRLFTP